MRERVAATRIPPRALRAACAGAYGPYRGA
jgi:hypothetical protein